MAHPQQMTFCKSVAKNLPIYFQESFVLDFGSLNINGSNQYLFDTSLYLGIDVAPGRNVDIVSPAHLVALPDECADVVISTECFEHDQFYDLTIRNAVRMLKPGGLLIFTCATVGRPEHGTRRTSPQDAPLLQDLAGWSDYYKNLIEIDIRNCIDVDNQFSKYEFSTNTETNDLYFWGMKHGDYKKRQNYSVCDEDGMFKRRAVALENTIAQLNEKLATTDSKLSSMQSSMSWRITAPLRFLRSKATFLNR